MPARGEHIVVGHDDGGCFQITSAALAQAAHKIVAHLGQIKSEEGKVVFADVPQEVVDLLCPQHSVVGLLAVDGGAARVGEIAGQFGVLLFRQSLEHCAHVAELLRDGVFLLPVHVLEDVPFVLFGIGEVVFAFVLAQLLVHLFFAVSVEMDAGKCVGELLDLAVGQAFQHIQQ